jgi:hypothetical protein
MLPALLLFAALLSGKPFWETSASANWSGEEITRILTESPWAASATDARDEGGVRVLLATAAPVRLAEQELARRDALRHPAREDAPGLDEYREFLRENAGGSIVLAVNLPASALDDPAERKRMEEECVLRVGRKKFKMTGHFPPSGSDSMLRLVFPRAVEAQDRGFRFDLYLPAIANPYRTVEFKLKELVYKGAPEY